MARVDFKNKIVWITGASSGIGASMALQLNKLGATVIASGRRTEKLIGLQKLCSYPEHMISLQLDITDSRSIEKAVDRVNKMDSLDLVIHNAGIAQKGLVIENEMEVDRKIMETNYFGTVALTKAILPIFEKQRKGWFAVVSSFAGAMGIPGRSAYAASKHALHGFFDSLKAEDRSYSLDISFVLPGFINTEITAKGLCGDGSSYGKVETSHRLGMSASKCAKDIIKGLKQKNRRIVVGNFEVYLLFIHRISPLLSHFIIKSHPMRRIRKFKSRIRGFFKQPRYATVE